MTETEIRKLREAVLQLWEGSKNIIVLREGITLYTQKLKKELAEKNFDSLGEPILFEIIKQNAWIAFLEGYDKNRRFGEVETKKAAVIALDSYLEMLKFVNLDSSEGKSLSPKINWKGTQTQLAYLVELLIKNKFLEYGEHWKMIAEHFTVEGEKIDNKQIATAIGNVKSSNKSRKPRKAQIIESIVKETSSTED
jgi:hypothetical protein|tara:strand:- start:4029 stop:4613 length:585 start_codon:yes stop_codon:yes gene_type:complete